jgi:hypothetical protein
VVTVSAREVRRRLALGVPRRTVGAVAEKLANQLGVSSERRLVERSELSLLDDIGRSTRFEKAAAQAKRKGGIGICHRAVQRPHLHRVTGRRLHVGAGAEQEREHLPLPEEARVPERVEAVWRVAIDEIRRAANQLAHPVDLPQRARFEHVEIIAHARQQLGDLLMSAVDREEDDRNPFSSRLRPRAGSVAIAAWTAGESPARIAPTRSLTLATAVSSGTSGRIPARPKTYHER